MKAKTALSILLAVVCTIFFYTSCTQESKKAEPVAKIENTLKSVSLLYDSAGIDPSKLLSFLERVNQAIDSIGFPDAGYKLWIVQSDTVKDFRFMLEGYWPDQAIYDSIHKHELYRNLPTTPDEDEMWNALKTFTYNRFIRVK